MTQSQELISILGFAHPALEIKESTVVHEAQFARPNDISFSIKRLSLVRILRNDPLFKFLMHVDQLLWSVDLVVLLDLAIVDFYLLADLGAAVGQQMIRHIEGRFSSRILLHLLSCLTGTEDLGELVFLVFVFLLFLFLALEQFLFEHLGHLLPDLLRDKRAHRGNWLLDHAFLVQSYLFLLLLFFHLCYLFVSLLLGLLLILILLER